MHSLSAFTPVLCDSGLQRGQACVWVCERKPATDILKACFSEKKKAVVRRFCKVMACGREVERVCAYNV